MSLPANVKLSVQGHSRPGDTQHSVPKQAMIVRMTAETLDALQDNPRMEFSFGSEPGIYIADTFFPMRPLKENSPHDLYLRASSASKPMAPLKLYANITGKFAVEQDLSKIEEKIRATTHKADTLRKANALTLLDAPPSDLYSSTNTKKKNKKEPTAMFTKPIPQPRPSTAARAPSPLPPLPPAASSATRTAVIKLLAVRERTLDELMASMPSESDATKQKRQVVALLPELAEPTNPGKTPSQWRLKSETWREVRPYEWSLTEQETTAVSRIARRIDPVKGASSATASSSKEPAVVPKRGVSSKEAKAKKAKPKVDHKAEILMKDESKPPPRVSGVKGKEIDEETSASASKAASSRRVPGSGTKIAKVESQTAALPPPTANPTPRGRPVDVRDRERPRASVPAKPAPPIPPPVQDKKVGAIQRIKKSARDSDASSDQERERRVSESAGKEVLKRKKPQDIDDQDSLAASASKRRKTDVGPVPSARDLSLPKKPETSLTSTSRPSVPKIKKEPSPLPPAVRQPAKKSDPSSAPPAARSSQPVRPHTTSTSSSNHAHTESHSSSKSSGSKRRRSPIYTSSEDEGEIRASSRREAVPLPTPPVTSGHPPNRSRAQPPTASRPLPTNRHELRLRYNATYLKYLSVHNQLFAQRSKLERILQSRDGSTVSDSDGDTEIMSTEETAKLKADHKR
ncbi:hypothetical protein C8J57DRAFT_1284446, partial [Mycena rebaudengoi]